MATRAMGKALGRRRCYAWLQGTLATTGVFIALAVCAGIGIRQEAGAEPLPEFRKIETTAERKQRFFDYLTPVVRAENDRIRRQRAQSLALHAVWAAGIDARDRAFLSALARDYGLNPNQPGRTLLQTLLRRVDVIPLSLVLAQAAKESGWGSSRFARQANNLFGQWCFETGCGLVPGRRPAGMNHEVRSFGSVRDSVESYLKNLNTHRSYRAFRALRAELRAAGRPLSGLRLAEGLAAYSARGDRYVREVQMMIRQNRLESEAAAAAVVGS